MRETMIKKLFISVNFAFMLTASLSLGTEQLEKLDPSQTSNKRVINSAEEAKKIAKTAEELWSQNTKESNTEAVKLFQDLYDQNQETGPAAYRLGTAYYFGRGVEKNLQAAFDYLSLGKDRSSLYWRGLIYANNSFSGYSLTLALEDLQASHKMQMPNVQPKINEISRLLEENQKKSSSLEVKNLSPSTSTASCIITIPEVERKAEKLSKTHVESKEEKIDNKISQPKDTQIKIQTSGNQKFPFEIPSLISEILENPDQFIEKFQLLDEEIQGKLGDEILNFEFELMGYTDKLKDLTLAKERCLARQEDCLINLDKAKVAKEKCEVNSQGVLAKMSELATTFATGMADLPFDKKYVEDLFKEKLVIYCNQYCNISRPTPSERRNLGLPSSKTLNDPEYQEEHKIWEEFLSSFLVPLKIEKFKIIMNESIQKSENFCLAFHLNKSQLTVANNQLIYCMNQLQKCDQEINGYDEEIQKLQSIDELRKKICSITNSL